jgi:cobalt/nickel transport system permease protein
MHYSLKPMHIPDGFLSVPVSLACWAISLAVIAYALRRANRDLGEKQIPLMGVLAACIFAGQMLNFAVAGGTSGHLMGSALATILLGPWAAMLVITAVVSVQALIFQDGGLLALGANILNMAVIGVAVSYFAYSAVTGLLGKKRTGVLVGGFVAGWLSIVIAALAVALQLALSGTSPANIAIPAMALIHAVIGIGEGLITAGALAFVTTVRPDLLNLESGKAVNGRLVWLAGLAIALALAILSPLASAHPDGLEWVAEQKGFLDRAEGPIYSIIPDYVMPGVGNEALATIIAGVLGLLIVSGVVMALAYSRRRQLASVPAQDQTPGQR